MSVIHQGGYPELIGACGKSRLWCKLLDSGPYDRKFNEKLEYHVAMEFVAE